MSFAFLNELYLYLVCGCVGFLAGVVFYKIRDEQHDKNNNILLDSDDR